MDELIYQQKMCDLIDNNNIYVKSKHKQSHERDKNS